jgi:hypothetical protein
MGDFFDYLIFLILFKKNTYNYYLVKISRKKKKVRQNLSWNPHKIAFTPIIQSP